ncbi:MAG: M15 family metallopeptidase [Alphaproteobacteria bacterium]|nr:M15 family metallopeptidase [Alphaproteobacteria bacterium]
MRGTEKLHPEVRRRAEKLVQLAMERFKLEVQITETLRTAEEQAALFAQSRKPLDEVNALRKKAGMAPIDEAGNRHAVTWAPTASDSFHGYGLAFDIVVKSGRQVDWSNGCDWNQDGVSDWAQVGGLAAECGLEWGGNWTSKPDLPHYQAPQGWTIASLKARGIVAGRTVTEVLTA